MSTINIEKSLMGSDPEDHTEDIDFYNINHLKTDVLWEDVEIENNNLKSTFVVEENFFKILKAIPLIVDDKKNPLHPIDHILLKKKKEDEICLYLYLPRDKRKKKITQVYYYHLSWVHTR